MKPHLVQRPKSFCTRNRSRAAQGLLVLDVFEVENTIETGSEVTKIFCTKHSFRQLSANCHEGDYSRMNVRKAPLSC